MQSIKNPYVIYYQNIKNHWDKYTRYTICLHKVEGRIDRVARGIAICSDKDNFNKKIGRQIAIARAEYALKNGIHHSESVAIMACWIGDDKYIVKRPTFNNQLCSLFKIPNKSYVIDIIALTKYERKLVKLLGISEYNNIE